MLTQQNKLATVFQYVGALHDSAGRSLRLFPSPIIGRTPRSMEEEGLFGKVACEFLLLAASARFRLVQGMYVMCMLCAESMMLQGDRDQKSTQRFSADYLAVSCRGRIFRSWIYSRIPGPASARQSATVEATSVTHGLPMLSVNTVSNCF